MSIIEVPILSCIPRRNACFNTYVCLCQADIETDKFMLSSYNRAHLPSLQMAKRAFEISLI